MSVSILNIKFWYNGILDCMYMYNELNHFYLPHDGNCSMEFGKKHGSQLQTCLWVGLILVNS